MPTSPIAPRVALTVDGTLAEVADASDPRLQESIAAVFSHGAYRVELLVDVSDVAGIDLALSQGFGFEGKRRDVAHVDAVRRELGVFVRTANDAGAPIVPAYPPFAGGALGDGTILLREAALADLDALIEQDGDPLTVAFGFGGVPTRAAAARMLTAAPLDRRVGPGALFAIVDAASGRFAGTIRIRANGPPQIANIGYAVHPAFRGRGYTSRALQLLSGWAFTEAGFARLELGARQDNIASQKAALAAGFQPDGTMRARLRTPDGTFGDEARFYLLPG